MTEYAKFYSETGIGANNKLPILTGIPYPPVSVIDISIPPRPQGTSALSYPILHIK